MDTPIFNQNIIRRTLKCSYHLGSGQGVQYSTEWDNVRNVHLVFYYHEKWDCYVVWNASILRKLGRDAMKANFFYGTELEHRMKESIPLNIECFDKVISYKGKHDYYEKVVLVPEHKLIEFCSFYEDYIYPSVDDLKTRKYLVALPDEEDLIECAEAEKSYEKVLRERDRISRARRNPEFRKRVLAKYNYTCIVCGCKEETILEAAHVIGVAEGGDDSTENGICLCRNHHRLYDAGLLDINLSRKKFSCNSEHEKKMSWYKEAETDDFLLHI